MSTDNERYILEGYAPKKPEAPEPAPAEPEDPVEVEGERDRRILAVILAIVAVVILLLVLFFLRSCSNPTEKKAATPAAPVEVTSVDFHSNMREYTLGDTADFSGFTITTSRPIDTTDPNQPFTCTSINVTVTNKSGNARTVDWDNAWLGAAENGTPMNTSWMITSGFDDQDVAVTSIEPGASIGASFVVAPSQADQSFYALVFSPNPTADGHAQGVYWVK